MTYQFVFNGHKYFASSRREYDAFAKLWAGNDWISIPRPFRAWYKFNGIERAPGWAPIQIVFEGIEYENKNIAK